MTAQPPSSPPPTAAASGRDLLAPFDYDPRTRVVYGPGLLTRLGELARELHGTRVLLVTDPGIRSAGHAARGEAALRESGLDVFPFDDVNPNPTTEDVDRALAVAREARIDLLVGLGGGSAMDCAKGVNFLLTNGGRMEDYWGTGKATRPMLPMIAVPTTAGTGSEAQSYALISKADSHVKMACGDRKAACRVALLDPELTVSMPRHVTAATGIDAVSHAIETFVCTRRNAISQLFGRRAWRLLAHAFPRVLREPDDIEARGAMLVGAHLAGAAIENSMLGATHALANPLSARFHVVHGTAIGVMLPHVIRFNAPAAGPLYAKLAHDAGLCDRHDPHAPTRLAEHLACLVERSGLPTDLVSCGVDRAQFPEMGREAAAQWTAQFNPRPVSAEQFEELYACATAPFVRCA
jgi:alcohol dehydrogenase